MRQSYLLVLGGMVVGLTGGWLLGRDGGAQSSLPVADHATALASGSAVWAEGVTQLDSVSGRGTTNLYTGYPAQNSDGTVNVVIEIPAGTNAKWEVAGDGTMTLEVRDGAPRVVNYLPYPGNYGMIPNTKLPTEQGGDGDPLDVLVLGPTVPRGSVVAVRLIGVMRFLDRGEQDDKLLAVMDDTPLADVRSLADLDRVASGARDVLQVWFTNYKGPGLMDFRGWGEVAEARTLFNHGLVAAEGLMPD